jgi:hypothetical protein
MRLGGPQSRSGRGGEEKILSSRRESNPRTPIVQPVAQRYTDWAITALNVTILLKENIKNYYIMVQYVILRYVIYNMVSYYIFENCKHC